MKLLLLDYFPAGSPGGSDCHRIISNLYLFWMIRRKKTGLLWILIFSGPFFSVGWGRGGSNTTGGHFHLLLHPHPRHFSLSSHLSHFISTSSLIRQPTRLLVLSPSSNLPDSTPLPAYTNPSIFQFLFFPPRHVSTLNRTPHLRRHSSSRAVQPKSTPHSGLRGKSERSAVSLVWIIARPGWCVEGGRNMIPNAFTIWFTIKSRL